MAGITEQPRPELVKIRDFLERRTAAEGWTDHKKRLVLGAAGLLLEGTDRITRPYMGHPEGSRAKEIRDAAEGDRRTIYAGALQVLGEVARKGSVMESVAVGEDNMQQLTIDMVVTPARSRQELEKVVTGPAVASDLAHLGGVRINYHEVYSGLYNYDTYNTAALALFLAAQDARAQQAQAIPS